MINICPECGGTQMRSLGNNVYECQNCKKQFVEQPQPVYVQQQGFAQQSQPTYAQQQGFTQQPQPIYVQQQVTPNQQVDDDKPGCLLNGLSFLIPVVGLGYYFHLRKTKPQSAKSYLTWGIIGFVTAMIFRIMMEIC